MLRRILAIVVMTVLAAGLLWYAPALAAKGGNKGGGKTPPPPLPTVTGVVVFHDFCTERVYVMNPDGTGRELLDGSLAYPRVQDVSRGGPGAVTALVLSWDTLYAIPVDGSRVVPLSIPIEYPNYPAYAVFSADGERIAYVSFEYDPVTFEAYSTEVYIANVVRDGDGYVTGLGEINSLIDPNNTPVDLNKIGQRDDSNFEGPQTGALDFSWDNSRLVVTIYDDLWVLELALDGHTLVDAYPLTRTPDFREWYPRWSPTDEVIAFSGGGSSGSLNIYTLDFSGVQVQVTKGRGYKQHPNWSPDGTYLLYDAQGGRVKRDSPCSNWINTDLYLIPFDGSQEELNVTKTTGDGVETSARWGW